MEILVNDKELEVLSHSSYSSEKTNMTSTTIGLIINYENFYISPIMGKIDDTDEVQIVLGMLLPQ